MVKAKIYILDKVFEGFPKASDFRLKEEELRPLKDNEFLAEAVYISVDPYMRAYIKYDSSYLKEQRAFMGLQVAKVTASRNLKFLTGKYVVADFGWRTHTISDGSSTAFPIIVLPDIGSLPKSLALGMLGMPGNTAYFGFLELCQPKDGETVVVSGAGGAVGAHVGQIAKIKGCKVIGIAGSDEKGKWLVEELGFDHFINYKTADLKTALQKAAPKGVDCYFDNVGGEMSSTIIGQMNLYGRISVCGSIGSYNDTETPKATILQPTMVMKQLKMEGFTVLRWSDRWMEGVNQNLEWISQGKLKYRETVTEGFENIFSAFSGMLKGENIGKAVVKI